MKRTLIAILICMIAANHTNAQTNVPTLDYKTQARKTNANYYNIVNTVREQLNAKRQQLVADGKTPDKDQPFREANAQFERWAYFWQDRVNADGSFPSSTTGWNNGLQKNPNLLNPIGDAQRTGAANPTWTNIGPNDSSILNGWSFGAGIGRVNVVKRSPLSKGYMLAGTAAGGVFKTLDLGSNWSPLTDQFAGLGVSDIVFHPTNDQIIIVATGDYDGSHMNSIGIMKSTNGGTSFTQTLAFTLNQAVRIKRLYLDPNFGTNNTIYCTATDGVYVSTNAGDSWNKQYGSATDENMVDIIKIGSDFFASDGWGRLYKSSTNVAALAAVYTPTPFGTANRLTFAFSANTPNILYCLFQTNPAFAKYTISTNTMSALSNVTNSVPADGNGNYNSQDSYNQVIAADPSNGQHLLIGEFSGKRSTDGGATWTNYLNGYYTPTGTTNWGGGYVHSDHHYIEFIGNDSIVNGNDGGVYIGKVSTSSFKQCFNGLKATQSYSIAIHDPSPDNLMIGNQDNDGSSRVENGSTIKWYGAQAGDGTATAISRTNANVKYVGGTNGSLSFRTDGFTANYAGNSIDKPSNGAFVWPLEMHITNGTILYGGFTGVFKMINAPQVNAGDWTNLNAGTTGTIKFINLANNTGDASKQRIVVIDASNNIRKTLDETTWASVTPPTGAVLNSIYWSRNNNDSMFATASGYTADKKIYFSTNAGGTWVNLTDNFPNIVTKKILKFEGSDSIFVATELGVYFARLGAGNTLVNAGNAWAKYSTGLPNVRVEDMEISYTSNKLFAGSFGRGVWVVDLRTSIDNYYSKATGNLNVLSTWGSNTDGSGEQPTSFTTTGVTYNVRNNATPTIAANWTVSGTGSKVIIGDGTNACNFTIPASTTVTSAVDVSASGTLTLGANSTIATEGRFILKSTANGTGKIAPLGTGASITGNVTTETYIPGGRRAFRFLSHPFSQALNMEALKDNIYITGTGAGFDATVTNNPSAFWFDNAAAAPGAWVPFTSSTDNSWTQYRGMRVLVRGDRNQPTTLTGANPTPNPVTLDVSGTVNTGNVNISLPSANNFHLVGNPYPAPTNIGSVIDATASIGTSYWLWDANAATKGAYVTRVVGGGAYNLAMNSAFVVQPTAATTLAFNEASKANSASANLFRTEALKNLVELELLYDNRHADNFFVRLDAAYKPSWDKMDGEKLFNPDINLYSVTTDGKQLCIDSRPFEKEAIIPITLTSTVQSSNLKFAVLQNSLDKSMELYLKDKLKNTLTKLDVGSSYDFEITTDSITQGAKRFELVMQKIATPANTEFSVVVYPNPTSKNITVSSINIIKSVSIYSVSGVQLTFANPNNKTYNFDMTMLPAGTYILNATDENGKTYTEKVVRTK
jgi:Secretion system C-terminal sorting domain